MSNSNTPVKTSTQTKQDIDYQIVSTWRAENSDLPLLYPSYETLEALEADMDAFRSKPIDIQVMIDDRSKIIFGLSNVARYKELKHELLVQDSKKTIIYTKEPKTKLKTIDPINAMMMMREYAETGDITNNVFAALEALDYSKANEAIDREPVKEEVEDSYYDTNPVFKTTMTLPTLLPNELDAVMEASTLPRGWGNWYDEYNKFVSGINNNFPEVHSAMMESLEDDDEGKLACGFIDGMRDGRVKEFINGNLKRISLIDLSEIDKDVLDDISNFYIPEEVCRKLDAKRYSILFNTTGTFLYTPTATYEFVIIDNELYVQPSSYSRDKLAEAGGLVCIVYDENFRLPAISKHEDIHQRVIVKRSPLYIKLFIKGLVGLSAEKVIGYLLEDDGAESEKYIKAITYTEYVSNVLNNATKQISNN